MDVAARILDAAAELRRGLKPLRFARPVTHVYNPLEYAAAPYETYVRRYGATKKKVVFLGMNPGPFGMAQTGIPFGEVGMVRSWLGISGPVGKPRREHPRRPVLGFDCRRSEVSGLRLWGEIAAHFKKPERFFARHFIANYCPLLFLEASGRNRTPDKLTRQECEPLFALCDRHLRRLVQSLGAEWVIGIGNFAAQRAEQALAQSAVHVGAILHPSPANPRANRDWAGTVRRQLAELGICGEGR